MKLNKDLSKEEMLLNIIDELYKGKATIENKIIFLIRTRRDASDKIQERCNTYLTKLYDEKYLKSSKENVYAQL
ncbi:MAG: hypothetical protein RR342_03775 [Bacilli bacterium]